MSTGSLFQVHSRQLKLVKLYRDLDLKPAELSFVLSLLEVCATLYSDSDSDKQDEDKSDENEIISVSRSELQNWLKKKQIKCGNTTLKNRANKLSSENIFTKSSVPKKGSRPISTYTLNDPSSIFGIVVEKEVESFDDHRSQRALLKDLQTDLSEGENQFLDGLPESISRSEKLWNHMLGACMRLSSRDKRTKIVTQYPYGNERIQVITTCNTDSDICNIDDLRTIKAIITLVSIYIQESIYAGAKVTEIVNSFYVDLVHILKTMDLKGVGGNRDTIRESMKRLYSTNFNLIFEDGSKAAADLGFDSEYYDDLNFKFLTELDSKKDSEFNKGKSVRKPRYYRISLHSKTFERLLNEQVNNTFIENKELLKVPKGNIHLLHSFCSIFIGRVGNTARVFSLESVKQKISPNDDYKAFIKRLFNDLKKYNKDRGDTWDDTNTRNQIDLIGYIIVIFMDDDGVHRIKAWRDRNDPVIGDSSAHIRLSNIAEQQKSISKTVA